MKQITSPADIKHLGTILSVWAHPDDETFTCGGLIATAAANGQRVACFTMTKGEAGSLDPKRWPPEMLGETRAKELDTALHILGCEQHRIFNYPDGGLDNVDSEEGVGIIKNLLEAYQPDTILTFGPEGMTGHADHQTVSRWVDEAVRHFPGKEPDIFHAVELDSRYEAYMKQLDKRFNIFFNIDKPPLVDEETCDILYRLPAEICQKKCAALAAMPSQTEGMMKFLGDSAQEAFAVETFVKSAAR